MINLDVLSFSVSVVELSQYYSRLRYAAEARRKFAELIEDRTTQVAAIRTNLTSFGFQLSPEERQCSAKAISRIESTLSQANKLAKNRARSGAARRWLRDVRWVLLEEETSNMLQRDISNYILTLVVTNSHLAVIKELRVAREDFVRVAQQALVRPPSVAIDYRGTLPFHFGSLQGYCGRSPLLLESPNYKSVPEWLLETAKQTSQGEGSQRWDAYHSGVYN